MLGIIRDSTSKMDHLITDILALSQVGRKKISISAFDMTSLVQSIYTEQATPAAASRLDFKVSALPNALCDRNLMQQVWVNLISNAIKYTAPREKGIIQINGSVADGFCTYAIRDNGVGFNPQYTEKLFGIFQRLHRAEDFEGTGVGLAIVARIINRHGGRVWAEGQVDAGATFYFSIPEVEAYDGIS